MIDVAPVDNGHALVIPDECAVSESALVTAISEQISAIESSVLKRTQPGEVAAKFLYRARRLALDGQEELAKRVRDAALMVLTGGSDE